MKISTVEPFNFSYLDEKRKLMIFHCNSTDHGMIVATVLDAFDCI